MAENDKINPAMGMQAAMMAAALKLEHDFAGATITIFIAEPGCSKTGAKPQYSHVSTAERADQECVLRDFLAEKSN